jgi:hypothetical protein
MGERPDVIVIDADFWGYPPYHKMMVNALGLESDESLLEEATRLAKRPTVRAADLTSIEEETP